MLIVPRLLQVFTCVATVVAGSGSVYSRSFQDAWEAESRKRQLPPAFEDRFRHEDRALRGDHDTVRKQWPRFYEAKFKQEAPVAAAQVVRSSQQSPDDDVFRNILKRANVFRELLNDDSNRFLGDNIALSGQAVREVFNNVTNHSRAPDMSRMRVYPGEIVPRKRRIGLRRFTRKLPFFAARISTRKVVAPTTTGTTTTTSRAPPAFFPTKRRKLFVRLRKVDKDMIVQKLVTKGVLHVSAAHTVAPRVNRLHHDQDQRPVYPRRVGPPRSVVEQAYAIPELRRHRKAHLSLSDGFLRKRFGTFKDLEVHLVSGGSRINFDVPDVEPVYKQAAIYKTPMDNTSVELFCLAAYKVAASVTWRVNGRAPEDFVSTETAFSKRDGGLKVIISRLRLQRLEVLPTASGNYTFECVANIDDADARAGIDVSGGFNNSCIDSSDCDARNALCTFGKCECKDFLPVPLNSQHTTCRSFGYIGWPCHYDEQCSYAVQNSACSAKGRCTCLQDFRRNRDNQSCVPRSGLGAECAEPKDCEAARAVCRAGHCRCPEGTSPRAGSCFDLPSAPLVENIKDKMFSLLNTTLSSPPGGDGTTAGPATQQIPVRKFAVSSAQGLHIPVVTTAYVALLATFVGGGAGL